MNKKHFVLFLLALGSIAVALYSVFDVKRPRSRGEDAKNLNDDWRKLHGDFTRAKVRFSNSHGA